MKAPGRSTTSCIRFSRSMCRRRRFTASLLRCRRSSAQATFRISLIVSTSYDLALERAFLDAGEEFDVVSYIAEGRNGGKFCHIDPGGHGTLIERPNEYASELSLDRRTVILKLHGQVDRTSERAWESFVVTEDHYIEYLARAEVSSVVPVGLAAKLRRSHFLFLGYSLVDWNLRLLLYRLWGDQPLGYRSWAVDDEPHPFELEFWRKHGVDVLDLPWSGVSTLWRRMPASRQRGPRVDGRGSPPADAVQGPGARSASPSSTCSSSSAASARSR